MGATNDSEAEPTLERRLGRCLNREAEGIEIPEPKRNLWSSNRSFSWMVLPAAAMVAVVAIIGAVLIRDDGLASTMTRPTFGAATTVGAAPTTTAPTAPMVADGVPEGAQDFGAARIVIDQQDSKISGVRLVTPEGENTPIASDFSSLSGEHLPLPVVSDGRGGFVLSITDYDDGRPTRDTHVIHVPAGGDRGITLIEPKGLADLAVVQSDTGWKAVYTTMLDGELRYWDLETHGEPVTQNVGGDPLGPSGVSSGGGRYLVYWLEGCPAVRLFDVDASEVDMPGTLSGLGCNGLSREYIVITPDGSRLVLLERVESEELVVVDVETGDEIARWDVSGYGHLSELTDEQALVSGEAGQAVVDLSDGEQRPFESPGQTPGSIRFDEMVLNPDLVLEPGGR